MTAQPLVSIIIPTYNRAHLIEETLDSVLAQTYQNWECLVVDDGSTDETDAIMQTYCEKDSRFRYYHRPKNKQKGANACRNTGLEKASGEFIIFFDSDDLMTKEHIQGKLKPLLESDYDYSIAKTKFFNIEDNSLERYYKFDEFEITPHNFIVQNINWLTYDTLIEVKLAQSVDFNEELQSGQEFNYFSKLVLKSTNALFIDEYLTLRRKHENSTQGKLRNENIKWKRSFKSMWLTYLEVKNDLSLRTKRCLLYKCIRTIYRQKEFLADDKILFLKEIYYQFGIFGLYNFVSMVFLRKFFGRGYSHREKLKSQVKM